MKNEIVAHHLRQIADLLGLKDVQWEPQAYRAAAETVMSLEEDIAEYYAERGKEGLVDLEAVGDGIATTIIEYLDTGTTKKLTELRKDYPSTIHDVLSVRGIGPSTVRSLNEELGVETVEDIIRAAKNKKIQRLEGFGAARENKILGSAEKHLATTSKRMILSDAKRLAKSIIQHIEEATMIRVDIVGSLRRYKETVGDIDVLVSTEKPEELKQHIKTYPHIKEILEDGDTKISFTTKRKEERVDIRMVQDESYATAKQYFTGSKDHNIQLRTSAKNQGLKLSEYALSDRETEQKIETTTERDVYESLGFNHIPPEIRQGTTELENAKNNDFQDFITEEDIRGDLHNHTSWSDGKNTVEEMAAAAHSRGYEYVAITDHSQSSAFAGGLKPRDLREHHAEVKEVSKNRSITVLSGSEVDILRDGSLDYDDDLLGALDVVVCSVHQHFDMPRSVMTKRIITAIEHPETNIVGHLTGRILNRRAGYDVDIDEVAKAAAKHDVALEISSQPKRLDLRQTHIHAAMQHGVKFAINTDSHTTKTLPYIEFGVGYARRACVTKDRVINTYPLSKLKKFLEKKS